MNSSRNPATLSRVSRDTAQVLLIDCQELFWDEMVGDRDQMLLRLRHLLMLAEMFGLPTLATQECPVSRKGTLPPELAACFPTGAEVFEKDAYDCTAESRIAAALKANNCPQVLVAGAETDVCVMQSVIGLRSLGYEVFVLDDCLFSSSARVEHVIERFHVCGALSTTLKSVAYELAGRVSQSPWLPEYSGNRAALPQEFQAPESW